MNIRWIIRLGRPPVLQSKDEYGEWQDVPQVTEAQPERRELKLEKLKDEINTRK